MATAHGGRQRLMGVLGMALLLLMFVVLLSLGGWQLRRAEEKRVLLEQFSGAENLPVLTSPVEDDAVDEHRYRKLRLRGRYVSSEQIFLDSMTYQGKVGYQVLTPFRPLAGKQWLLVNRGWIEAHPDRRILPHVDVDESTRTVQGRIAPLPQPGLRLGDIDQAQDRVLLFPTAAELQSRFREPLHDYQILLDASEPDGYVRDWRPTTLTPERHVAYAVQWYAGAAVLAAAIAFIGLRSLRRRRSQA